LLFAVSLNIENRKSTIDHRQSIIDHRKSTIDNRQSIRVRVVYSS